MSRAPRPYHVKPLGADWTIAFDGPYGERTIGVYTTEAEAQAEADFRNELNAGAGEPHLATYTHERRNWAVRCSCGWTSEFSWWPTRASAERAHADHLERSFAAKGAAAGLVDGAIASDWGTPDPNDE